ncbi:MAG: LptF/LptG family permease [Desulfovibrionaceae bacterium]|nr:LptF/LptG family permease [Desulfovibrionaceae bacterium]
MTLLFRYVFLSHARLLLLTLSVGVGLYLLTELVENVDTFVEAETGLWVICQYYAARLPSIIAQILPAVFLLASVISLCLMAHARETIALQAGGVSPHAVAFVLVLCGLFWGGAQLACSQFLGASGDAFADRVWREQVRKRAAEMRVLSEVWFTDRSWIVSLDTLREDGEGSGLTAYQLSEDGLRFVAIVHGADFRAESGAWRVRDAVRTSPDTFVSEAAQDMILPLRQDASVFFVSDQDKPQQLPLWLLGESIRKLREAGSNVEALLTAWHSKLAYAASLMVMAVLAAAIVSWRNNVYLAVALSMAVIFVTYALTLFGESIGQRGLLPPILAAWGPDLLLLTLALAGLHLADARR